MSVGNVLGRRLKISWHCVRKLLYSPGNPSYLLGGGNRGSQISGLDAELWWVGAGVVQDAGLGLRSLDCSGQSRHLVGHGLHTLHDRQQLLLLRLQHGVLFCWSWAGSAGSILVRTYCNVWGEEPDADQSGCRIRCLFKTESVARISEIRSTKSLGKRVVNQNQNQNQLSQLQTRQTGTRQTLNHKSKGCLVLNHYKLAYTKLAQNKDQRSDGQTEGQTGVYCIYTRILNTLRQGCPIMFHGGPRVCRFSFQPITATSWFHQLVPSSLVEGVLISEVSRCSDWLEWKPAYSRPSMAHYWTPLH